MFRRGRQKRRSIKKKRSQSAPAIIVRSPVKKNKRKQWTNERMVAAMEAVETGKSGINRAAVDHGVPKTTLKNRLSGHVKHGKKPGPECYLNEEEKELASFVKSCASIGYGKTRREVLGIAQSVATDKGVLRGKKISQGWWRRFFRETA